MKSRPKIKSRNWMLTLSLASTALAYVFLVFVPAQSTIAQSRRQIREMQQYIVDSARLTSTIAETEAKLEKTQSFVRDWRSSAPRLNELGTLFGQITEQAKSAGATILRFAPAPTVEFDSLYQVPIQLSMEGSYQQLFAFVRGLEELPATIWVEQCHLEPAREAGEKLRCQIKLTVFADKTAPSD